MNASLKLTPADFGIIAATLDDLAPLGDDDATDELAKVLEFEAGLEGSVAYRLAYRVVHVTKRKLVNVVV